jgi:hypothetical protein
MSGSGSLVLPTRSTTATAIPAASKLARPWWCSPIARAASSSSQRARPLFMSLRREFVAGSARGVALTYESDALPGEVHIQIGALDRPEDFRPHGTATFAEERLPWFRIAGVD